jgi:phosphate transport system substrate-binding protein
VAGRYLVVMTNRKQQLLCTRLVALGVLAAALIGPGNAAFAETLRIGGTGAATGMLPKIAAAIPAGEDITIEVIPSLGSGGGLLAVEEAALDIAVSGRPLKSDEKARGLTQAAVIRTPFVLATSYRQPNGFKSNEIADIYRSTRASWPDGTLIRIILRPKSDSDTPHLAAMFPGMAAAMDVARLRPDIPIAATDQDNLALAEQVSGSLAGSSLTQVQTEQRNLRLIAINGVAPSLDAFESGAYPFGKFLYFVLPARKNPAAERFIAFLNSPPGQRTLRETGNLLITE